MSGRQPVPVEDLPPLNQKLTTPMECGGLSEHELLSFLREANEEARDLKLSRPSERTKIHLQLRQEGSIPDPGYREWIRFESGAVPSIEVGSKSARKAIRYVAKELLPFTERMLIVTEELRAAVGIWVGKGQTYGIAGGVPSFRENTEVAERFLELFKALGDDEKTEIRSRINTHPLTVAANRNALHLKGDRWIIVGKYRIDEVFNYMLTTLPAIEEQVADRTAALKSKLGLLVHKSDSDILHTDYLELLDRIVASTVQFSADEIEIIRNIEADVHISGNRSSDLSLTGRNREIYISPIAADNVLKFLIESEDELQPQEPRRE